MSDKKEEELVAVVRCKDCKWRGTHGPDWSIRSGECLFKPDDWYCAEGERKPNETDK